MARLQRLVWLVPGLFLAVALAPGSAAADNFGAISFSMETGAVGYAIDYDTRAGAEARAQEECAENDCEVTTWFMNACGALATGDNNGYGSGWSSTRARAEEIAVTTCSENALNCTVTRWVCTSR